MKEGRLTYQGEFIIELHVLGPRDPGAPIEEVYLTLTQSGYVLQLTLNEQEVDRAANVMCLWMTGDQ